MSAGRIEGSHGRALALHARGSGFESRCLLHLVVKEMTEVPKVGIPQDDLSRRRETQNSRLDGL